MRAFNIEITPNACINITITKTMSIPPAHHIANAFANYLATAHAFAINVAIDTDKLIANKSPLVLTITLEFTLELNPCMSVCVIWCQWVSVGVIVCQWV